MKESVLQRRLSLEEMLDLPTFTEVVKSFAELYRIGIKVFDEKGGRLADVKLGTHEFCASVFSYAPGKALCTATVSRVKEEALEPSEGASWVASTESGPPLLSIGCPAGPRYLVVPITWEGDRLGRIVFGPFLPDDLTGVPSSFLEQVPGADRAKLEEQLSKFRKAPEATVARVVRHFCQLVDTMVAAGQKSVLTAHLHIEAMLETNRQLDEQNRRLEAMNRRLKELDRLKSSFLATVSHELRTPLTSIIGYSDMLSEGMAGPLNAEQADYIQTISEKGETLLRLIGSILDLSQIEAGKVRLNFMPIDPAELLRSAISSVQPQAAKKNVRLLPELPPKPLTVTADLERLKQVAINLLANAVKFTPEGGQVRVRLSELEEQPELSALGYRLVVEDSGVGIPEEQLERIFESFYQVDSSSTREFGGAGLGLAIVKSFVEGHGGTMRVQSELGRGSRFTAVLPVAPAPTRSAQVSPPLLPTVAEDRF